MKKIIITTGYMGSGSSAATDIVAEFENCSNEYSSFEYVFLHCPDGLFDLEDRLLLNNNANRSDEALRTFRKRMQELYDKKFWWVGNYQHIIGSEFMRETDAFIKQITQFQFDGYWYMHERVDFKMFFRLLIRKPAKILLGKRRYFPQITRYENKMAISYITPQNFYKAARKYIEQIIDDITGTAEFVVLDQLLLPFNLYRMRNYFDDNVYAIVVDRDPRDVFILNKYIWPSKNISVPIPNDVNIFCEYYEAMRKSEKKIDNVQILRLHFEDLVYNYEDTLDEITKHIGLRAENHIHKKKRFDPAVSIANTQLFHDEKYAKEISVIEQKLASYLYDFPEKICNSIEHTIEFE